MKIVVADRVIAATVRKQGLRHLHHPTEPFAVFIEPDGRQRSDILRRMDRPARVVAELDFAAQDSAEDIRAEVREKDGERLADIRRVFQNVPVSGDHIFRIQPALRNFVRCRGSVVPTGVVLRRHNAQKGRIVVAVPKRFIPRPNARFVAVFHPLLLYTADHDPRRKILLQERIDHHDRENCHDDGTVFQLFQLHRAADRAALPGRAARRIPV